MFLPLFAVAFILNSAVLIERKGPIRVQILDFSFVGLGDRWQGGALLCPCVLAYQAAAAGDGMT